MAVANRSPGEPTRPRTELLHEGPRNRVTRWFLPGGPVLRKELLGPGSRERLRQEFAILERLAGVPGVVRLADRQLPDSVTTVDVAGRSLASLRRPVSVPVLTRLGLALATTVAGIHQRGVVHRGLNPDTIQLTSHDGTPAGVPAATTPASLPDVDRDVGEPVVVDFSFATTFAEVRPEFGMLGEENGAGPSTALSYLAPEQTGRTGRPVDQRADLYALGAILYELATGSTPFDTIDPLRLSRDQLTRVPVAPSQRREDLPDSLSSVIMHLLSTEPDNRYQTAEGLIYDLTWIRERELDPERSPDAGRGTELPFTVGEHDFPTRLRPPSRLVGRDHEIARLAEALQSANSGHCPGVIIGGGPGMGKSALVDELRPITAASNGWFVYGKFDEHRRDREFDALRHAFRSLARLLLAEPEDELAELRIRLRKALGDNAGLCAAVLPELGTAMDVPPEQGIGDPLTAETRLQSASLEMVRTIGSPKRPLVFVVDDLQWATQTQLGFVDMVMSDQHLDGVLLACTYREPEVDRTHPLTAMIERWREHQRGVVHLRLGNLPVSATAAMIADMLRLDTDRAVELAELVEPYARGNPYETVEVINSLRHVEILAAAPSGWRWDPAAVRAYLGRSDPAEQVSARADALPLETNTLLATMACLGGRVELEVLAAGAQLPATEVDRRLEPAMEAGLLVLESGQRTAARFRHDRVQEVMLRRLGDQEPVLRLRSARALAEVPGLADLAADQYLPVVDRIEDHAERRRAVELLHRATEHAALIGNHQVVERFLGAAVRLLRSTLPEPAVTAEGTDVPTSPAPTNGPVPEPDRRRLLSMQSQRHTALVSLGRLLEADEVYQDVIRLANSPPEQAPATAMQLGSLTRRNRSYEAVELGLAELHRLGWQVPEPEQLGPQIGAGLAELTAWVAADEPVDLDRPEITDPNLVLASTVMNAMLPPAYFIGHPVMAWLCLTAWRIWVQHGPGRTLVGPVAHLHYVTLIGAGDYRTGYLAVRRLLAESEAHRFEPNTSQFRFLLSMTACWFEPLERGVELARRAREGLIHGGDLENACYTYFTTIVNQFDYLPTLAEFAPELEAGMEFAARLGNQQAHEVYDGYRRLLWALRGEGAGRGELPSPEDYEGNLQAQAAAHNLQAHGAALFDDPAALARHTEAAMSLRDAAVGSYPSALTYLLRSLSLAQQVRAAPARERAPLLSELDQVTDWIAARAADAPDNFLHLLRLVEAERAWAAGDFRAAALAFDTAQQQVSRRRPWHRALILERGARFYLAQGLEHTGKLLLGETRAAYAAWGAKAKVDQIDWAFPALRVLPPAPSGTGGSALAAQPAGALAPEAESAATAAPGSANGDPARSALIGGAIDLLGILAASQALSSETTVDGLRDRVREALSAMTGATAVHLLFWDEPRQAWVAQRSWLTADPDHAGQPEWRDQGGAAETMGDADLVPVENAPSGQFPVSAIRYAQRTRRPLVVDDAVRDERFARDPYFATMRRCSLLAAPVLSQGRFKAMLLLENQLLRGAFSSDRLDGVMMIASQLAVSLDNAMVYASLERRVAERTEQLAQANQRLAALSVTDALTGLANRRRLEEVLSAEWLRSQRTAAPISVAMVDIDRFKAYNDEFGHAAGDRCLQRVAGLLRDNVRDMDLVARYGGEEFVVVMPETAVETAVAVAERLRTVVAELAPRPELAEEVTVSVGVATMVHRAERMVDHLLEAADTELYRAKRAGRNRVSPQLRPAPAPGSAPGSAPEPGSG